MRIYKWIVRKLKISKNKIIFYIFSSRKIDKLWEKSSINLHNKGGEIVSCPYCGSNKSSFYYKTELNGDFGLFDKDFKRLDVLYGIHIKNLEDRTNYFNAVKKIIEKKSFIEYLKCSNCGLIYQNYPHEEETMSNHYSKLYRSMYADVVSEYGRGMDEKFLERKNLIAKYFLNRTKLPQYSKILDFGCAEGIVCNFLKEAGMIPYGIDPCMQEVKYAKEHFGLDNITLGNYGLKSYPKDSFDGIITHHVLEHVLNVKEVFEAMCWHLKPNGYLLIQCPHVVENGLSEKSMLTRDHIVGYTREFLVNILEKNIELIEILETPHEIEENFSWVYVDRVVSAWGDVPNSISILVKKKGG